MLARLKPETPPILASQAKKIPTDKGWDFTYWWWGGNRCQTRSHQRILAINNK